MRKIGIIPARYKSTRFPGKPLVLINGTPMILLVAKIVEKALGHENTYIATEDDRIKDVVTSAGYKVIMTTDNCLTGTDRVWEAAQQVEADIYLNIQGDEPLLNPDDINLIASQKEKYFNYVINGMCILGDGELPTNPNIPKVLTNKNQDLLYMSRLPIPGIKGIKDQKPLYKKQVCIYAFSYNDLKLFGESKKKAEFEYFEDIEILRFFDLNVPIKMIETSGSSAAVDEPSDVLKIEQAINNMAQ
ncbi:3-deoxy-manno-octulosonate cytidylyltransferase (CMP-KDO synthetase) [Maribacter spongiicola]|uniref:3-deoxy-manno-octulosonate cytidylyltransferase (CMP-KDO synthetase) n=1 Tax=Maribacter spongiicola TaxID=1206753 RepID=A0A4R7K5R2_9FLAO|nr:3-deoxy-manno-octulosonate cytidylyltransferase [Maribacter spongiicola]TDT46340.1 3-deoxy-manno-octulosonate cytidylyltransferase (CMP-KDO synthetase) [Maribacter spongiicola]